MKLRITRLITTLSVLLTCSFLAPSPLFGEGSTTNNPDKTCPEPGEEGDDPEEDKEKDCEECKSGDSSCPPGTPESGESDPETDSPTGEDEECGNGTGTGIPGGGGGGGGRSRSARRTYSGGVSLYPGCISTSNIRIYGSGQEILRDADTAIRQIRTKSALTDYQMEGPGKMVVRVYNISDIKGKANGLYTLKEGAEPFKINTYTETDGGYGYTLHIVDKTAAYPSEEAVGIRESYDPATNTKTLLKTWYKVNNGTQTAYKKTSTALTPLNNGLPQSESYICTVEELGTDGQWYVVKRTKGQRATFSESNGAVHLYKCNAVDESGNPLPDIATENTYTYYTDRMDPASYGKVKTLRRNDGYWENRYYGENTSAGMKTYRVESPWGNTQAHEPGTTPQGMVRTRTNVKCSTDSGLEDATEKVGEVVIKKEWTEKSPAGKDQVKLVRHQPHAGGDKITTTIRYRKAKDVPEFLTGLPVSIVNADGSKEIYTYVHDANTNFLTTTCDKGYGDGESVTKGIRTITTKQVGKTGIREEIRYALEGGQAYWLSSKTGVEFDNAGYCLKWIYDNNPDDYTQEVKDCCRVSQERGRDGIMTYYAYDPNGRLVSTTTRGITTSTEYKGLATINWKQAEGSNNRFLVEEQTNNLAGNTVKIVTPVVGNKTVTTTKSYDIATRKTRTTTPFNTWQETARNSDGQIQSETGTTGLTTVYSYAPSTNMGGGLEIIATEGERITTKYLDMQGNTVSTVLNNGALATNVYDAAARLIKTTSPDGEVMLYIYEPGILSNGLDIDGDDILNPVVDRISKNVTVFDSSWPENKGSWKTTTLLAWEGEWKETSIIWETEDNTLQRSQTPELSGYNTVEQPLLFQRGNSYMETKKSSDGQRYETSYTLNNGNMTSAIMTWKDSNGDIVTTTVITMDIWGFVLTETKARIGQTIYTNDEATGRILDYTTADGSVTRYEYDNYGRQVATVLPDGTKQNIEYDQEGRVTRQWGSQQYPVSYEYDARGQKTAMITYRATVENQANWPAMTEGDRTTWIYEDSTGNLLQKLYADGKGLTYTYTPGGKMKTLTNARGNVTTHNYDGVGQLISTVVNDNLSPAKSFTYDQWSRCTSVVTQGIYSYRYKYNNQNKIVKEDIILIEKEGSLNREIIRNYDQYGRRTGYQLKNGEFVEQSIVYQYNEESQLCDIIADEKEFHYIYVPDAPHLIDQVISPVHVVTNSHESHRDQLNNKNNCWKNKPGNPSISRYVYAVNNLGQPVSLSCSGEAFGVAPKNLIFGYDVFGQINISNEDRYTYDQIGNRLSSKIESLFDLTYTSNTLNQYSQIGGCSPNYDADGNQIAGLTSASSSERSKLCFSFDAENRLVSVTKNEEEEATYKYDYMGRRIKDGDSIILYDGFNAIARYDDNTFVLKTTYAWGNDLSGTLHEAGGVGGLLSVSEYRRQLPLISYPCYDGNGNITEYLTEEDAGLLVAHYEYDIFGNIFYANGNLEYEYQFSTKPYNKLTGLSYYNYRDYDSVSGRWLSRDPAMEEEGANLYCFVSNKPAGHIDVLGRNENGQSQKKVTVNFTPPDPASIVPKYIDNSTRGSGVSRGYTFTCECLECEDKKYSINCTATYSPVITINKKEKGLGKKDKKGNIVTLDGIYGHEQRHVESRIKGINKILDKVREIQYDSPKKDYCENKAKNITQTFSGQIADFFKSSDHLGEGGGGPESGVSYPPFPNSPPLL